jgi:hypothetical protein
MMPDSHAIHKQFADMILTVKNDHLKDDIMKKFLQTDEILKKLKTFSRPVQEPESETETESEPE